MSVTLMVHDENTAGEKTNEFKVTFSSSKISVRELIRNRVYQEVQDYNLSSPEYFRGLVQPTNAEKYLNGYKLRERRKLDWEEQFHKAEESFERNGFIVLINNHQAKELDEVVELSLDTKVSFLKLVPLVGG